MNCVEIGRAEDSPFNYRNPRPTALLHASHSWMCDLSDCPDEADQLAPHGHGGDRGELAATGHSMKLSIQPQITFLGDVD
jgi:hypothetical protein